MIALDYVVPVHNEAATVAGALARLADARARYPIDRVIAVENGSRDDTWAILSACAAADPRVHAFTEPAAGIGHAYHRGIVEALALAPPAVDRYLVLTACDLPFGFTDVDGLLAGPARPEVVIGSKALLTGGVRPAWPRRAMSRAYQLARRALLGMRTRDCQGSFLVRSDVAAAIYRDVAARDFFYTTELCARLERRGVAPREVPVALEPELRPSTVRPPQTTTLLRERGVDLRRELDGGVGRGFRRKSGARMAGRSCGISGVRWRHLERPPCCGLKTQSGRACRPCRRRRACRRPRRIGGCGLGAPSRSRH